MSRSFSLIRMEFWKKSPKVIVEQKTICIFKQVFVYIVPRSCIWSLPSLEVREMEQENTGHWSPTTNSLSIPCPEILSPKKDWSNKILCCVRIPLTSLAHQSCVKNLALTSSRVWRIKLMHLQCPVLVALIASDSLRQILCHFRNHILSSCLEGI